jgi:hypothetical protein
LDNATKTIYPDRKTIYLNCEDFKNHSFPNVLIEILDAVFAEMERHLTGWFGKKKKSKDLIKLVRKELTQLRAADDARYEKVRERQESENSTRFAGGLHTRQDASAKLDTGNGAATLRLGSGLSFEGEQSHQLSEAIERSYERADSKIKQLDLLLPKLKGYLRDFFEMSSSVKTLFIQLDDFYHLPRENQPHIADYIHRLCKDMPMYFKVATLRHASVLYAERQRQPVELKNAMITSR